MDHHYTPDPQSGAGNCRCGASKRHRRHPHEYLHQAPEFGGNPKLCTCGLPPEAECHVATLPTFWETTGGAAEAATDA